MREKHEPTASVEHITDEEIMLAIQYLDPDRSVGTSLDHSDERSVEDNRTVFVVCVSLIALLLGELAYIWLYLRTF